jgi:hypothetical protein
MEMECLCWSRRGVWLLVKGMSRNGIGIFEVEFKNIQVKLFSQNGAFFVM